MALVSRKLYMRVVVLITWLCSLLMPSQLVPFEWKAGSGNGATSSSEVLSVVSRALLGVQEHKTCFPGQDHGRCARRDAQAEVRALLL